MNASWEQVGIFRPTTPVYSTLPRAVYNLQAKLPVELCLPFSLGILFFIFLELSNIILTVTKCKAPGRVHGMPPPGM